MKKIAIAVQSHPTGFFLAFLALHAAVWTVLPAQLYANLPLDLIEALVYGREWQLGYDKLPPLPWWMIEACYRLLGADLFYYALAQATVIAAFALVWVLARSLVGPIGALVAILVIDGLHYFNFTAPKFNHDVIQLPFWALAGYAYWAALRRGRILYWLLLGFAIGMALWAKYFVVVLAAPLALFTLLDRDARKSLATPGPYISIGVALLVMSPLLVWLVQNDFLPFGYLEQRGKPFHGALDYFLKPPLFLVLQLGTLLPSLLIAAPCIWQNLRATGPSPARVDAFDRRIVSLLAFGPAATVVLVSLVTGRQAIAMWGYPLWLFIGLWLVMRTPKFETVTLMRVLSLWGIVSACFVGAFIFHTGVRPHFGQRYFAELFPGDRLGHEMSSRFRAITGQPLAYVIGDIWVGGNVSHYAPERPRLLIDGASRRAPWIDLRDLRTHGAVVVWNEGRVSRGLPAAYAAIARDAEIQEPFPLPFRSGGRDDMIVGWAILRPQLTATGVNSPP